MGQRGIVLVTGAVFAGAAAVILVARRDGHSWWRAARPSVRGADPGHLRRGDDSGGAGGAILAFPRSDQYVPLLLGYPGSGTGSNMDGIAPSVSRVSPINGQVKGLHAP